MDGNRGGLRLVKLPPGEQSLPSYHIAQSIMPCSILHPVSSPLRLGL
jgi:hypothetical protein